MLLNIVFYAVSFLSIGYTLGNLTYKAKPPSRIIMRDNLTIKEYCDKEPIELIIEDERGTTSILNKQELIRLGVCTSDPHQLIDKIKEFHH